MRPSLFALTVFFILMVSFSLFFVLGIMVGNGDFQKIVLSKSSHSNSNCTSLGFKDTVNCLNNDFSSWFVYNLSNAAKTLSNQELKEVGGVCSHASTWYVQETKAAGYNGIYVSFGNTFRSHAVAILYNNNLTEYCLVDQTNLVGCGALA